MKRQSSTPASMISSVVRATGLAILLLSAAQAQPQNLTIVSIGDSFASGEGNPNSFNGLSATWTNTPCHQSVHNGRRMASDRINGMPNTTTDFFDFSCSGAGVNAGILGPMQSVAPETPEAIIHAQLDRVVAFQQQNNNRPIDILMVSIGGNDAGFGSVVLDCMLPGNCANSSTVLSAVQRINSTIPGLLDNLATQIASRLHNVRFVYLTEYPNPLKAENGQPCDGFSDFFTAPDSLGGIAMAGISGEESQFLQDHFVNPLNNQLAAAATRHSAQGWKFVTGVKDTYARHGFCTGPGQRWVNTLGDSFARQGNVKGTMHPNILGHEAYADSIVRRATLDFNLPTETPRIVDIVEINDAFVNKRIRAEISQTPATLQVQVQFRVRNVLELSAPAFTTVGTTEIGTGALNFFDAALPNTSILLPGARIEYRIRVIFSRNGVSNSFTTGSRFIEFGEASN